jgi:hypothetical protein
MRVTVERRPAAEAAADLLAVPLTAPEPKGGGAPGRLGALDRALGGRLGGVIGSGGVRG